MSAKVNQNIDRTNINALALSDRHSTYHEATSDRIDTAYSDKLNTAYRSPDITAETDSSYLISIEEAMTGVMTELILRECMEKAQAESSLAKPKIDNNVKIKLSKEHLKELQNYAFSGLEEEDVVDHITKVLEILDSIKIPMYQANPKESYLVAVKRIFRDCQILGGKLVCWSAKKQNSVAMSSAKAEYAATDGCSDPSFTRLVAELGMLNIEKVIPDKEKNTLGNSGIFAKVDGATNPITVTLSNFDKPLSFGIDEFSSIIGLNYSENYVSAPKKENVRAHLETLGLVDEKTLNFHQLLLSTLLR
ncbi:hypothetical protein Tco_0952308 [Tanacetum coccineum]|uniref:Uncharacterized protein n=1 Tax=Tanacetum coccineum TaxID=301880 RepID=A0ABQ5DYG1_9ASTR